MPIKQLAGGLLSFFVFFYNYGAHAESVRPVVTYHYAEVNDVKVFYREAGDPAAPSVLLLHGFPTSSFMYRNLMGMLADKYHVIAPDLPGFGYTSAPPRDKYTYSFENLANTIDQFTDKIGLRRYALEVFDYGAPIGWRLATAHPERITAIISQNGNAYVEGLSKEWDPIQKYWSEPSQANRDQLRRILTPDAVKWQYTQGAHSTEVIAPDSYTLDSALLTRPGNVEIQLDLFKDYKNNVAQYPLYQQYFRKFKPPLLAVWGKNDPLFLPAGAQAFKKDIPEAKVVLVDAGHFALESDLPEIGAEIHRFLDATLPPTQ
ncbi:Alpha/beta hydrolase [Caballeronia fortuita]|uniref:Alpha/beta hydrolase n=1 Tax=Caballeronia fortuita TaxID=1777138 RepID=A0A158CT85_9BURK|nr:alpha/beta hydrolase [Caballeronia fortuita]SAK85524.1 Alpha/beta hydrolase [Caballeronia fortuita]